MHPSILLYGCLLILVSICSVKAQNPDIVDEIWPEVKRKGQTGRLNCTVINKKVSGTVVVWSHSASTDIISRDTEIAIYNPEIEGQGKYKYDVKETIRGSRYTYTLIIANLGETDAGEYVCYVQQQNVPLDQWPQKKGNITVLIAPKVLPGGTTSIVEVSAGANYNMTCEASGIPAPNITWTRADGGWLPHPIGGARYRGRIMPLVNITAKMRGVYRCIADNNVPTPAEHFAELRVFFQPSARPVQDTVGQAQNRRFDAILHCITAGYPEPTVSWWRRVTDEDNSLERLADTDRFEINKQTSNMLMAFESLYSLKIKNVLANDYTEYQCQAANRFGANKTSLHLFETTECQGPNCPSFKVGGAPALRQTSSLFISLLVTSIFFLKL